ncbi:formate dehydrogenase subunit gamma [Castellaniella caeni]|uniref:formate dehydrogenase subunit gamma n=1 Tax=Castellaniella caeni TaxID=266123 RepID=UPI000832047D|nr:formate dehydrogenase subunit gamma [Castellaniella caeni]
MSDTPRLIDRYTASQRSNHWAVAILFILLALSGLALFHPALFWLTNLFGGGTWTRILHPFVGVLMFLLFLILALRMIRHNGIGKSDRQWLCHVNDVINKHEERVPEVGRYNAGQKLVYWVSVICMIGLILTGLVMWREYFSLYFSMGVVQLASALHAIFAFVMICTIIIHIYAGIWVKGSMRAMTRGSVTAGWAWKHHHAWFRQTQKAARK